MRDKAVQPPRDPTGSQKDKKKTSAGSRNKSRNLQRSGKTASELIREQQLRDGAGPSIAGSTMGTAYSDEEADDFEDEQQLSILDQQSEMTQPAIKSSACSSSKKSAADKKTSFRVLEKRPAEADVKMEEMDEDDLNVAIMATVGRVEDEEDRGRVMINGVRVDRPWEIESADSGYERFKRLIICYREHTRLMQLAMTPIESFLGQAETSIKLREMVPGDVSLLSTTELSGLLYWIEKLEPYSDLPACDRRALFKRYSVRKLSLDHFYTASKWTEECKKGNFVMLNNTFVPPNKTGFELETDDEKQVKAKAEILLPTFEQMWRCVIWPFARMKITDAEMVFLHTLLLWSPLNNMHVGPETKDRMSLQREWAIRMLFQHYEAVGQEEPPVRFGEVVQLLAEVEVICDRHCQDFQVAKLFEFCDMSQFWYEKWCYSAPLRPDYSKMLQADILEMMEQDQSGTSQRDDVNTMQVPAGACMSPLYNEQGETADEMFERALAEATAAKEQRKQDLSLSSAAEEVLTADGDGDDYVVPEKKPAHERTPSAPSTTPSTPNQPSLHGQ